MKDESKKNSKDDNKKSSGKSSEKDDKIVNDAIANNNKVVASAVKKAIEKNEKAKEEAQTEVILKVLEDFDKAIGESVTTLKDLRSREKRAKGRVVILSKAKDLFTETADPAQVLKYLIDNNIYDNVNIALRELN